MLLCLAYSNTACANERLVNINDIDWPPYFFIDNKTKQFTLGIAKEILNHCLTKSGYAINYIRLPIQHTYDYMEQGMLDITIYSPKKSRNKSLFYAKEPIFSSEYGFMVRADSDIKITQLEDVIPYQIGHLAGLTYTPEYMKIIQDKLELGQVTVAHNLEVMFAQLLAANPRFEIMADSKATFHWYAKKIGVSEQIKVLDYTIKNKNYFITISKRSEQIENPQALLNKTDACIKQLKQSGEYRAILKKYGQ